MATVRELSRWCIKSKALGPQIAACRKSLASAEKGGRESLIRSLGAKLEKLVAEERQVDGSPAISGRPVRVEVPEPGASARKGASSENTHTSTLEKRKAPKKTRKTSRGAEVSSLKLQTGEAEVRARSSGKSPTTKIGSKRSKKKPQQRKVAADVIAQSASNRRESLAKVDGGDSVRDAPVDAGEEESDDFFDVAVDDEPAVPLSALSACPEPPKAKGRRIKKVKKRKIHLPTSEGKAGCGAVAVDGAPAKAARVATSLPKLGGRGDVTAGVGAPVAAVHSAALPPKLGRGFRRRERKRRRKEEKHYPSWHNSWFAARTAKVGGTWLKPKPGVTGACRRTFESDSD